MISNLLKISKDMIQGPTSALENVGTITMMINCAEKLEEEISSGSPIYAVINIVKDICFASKDFREKVLWIINITENLF